MNRDDFLAYYHWMYAPNNMLLVIISDVTLTTPLAQVKKTFVIGKRHHMLATTQPPEQSQVGKRTTPKEIHITQDHRVVSLHTVPLTRPTLYALDI